MTDKNQKTIEKLRSQLSDNLLPQPDAWDSERVLAAWSRYQALRDEAEDFIDEAHLAEAAIGRATSAYEGRYRDFLNGKLDSEPEEPDYAGLRDAATSATARAGAAVSRALGARGTYQRLLKSEENQKFRFEKAQAAMMPARERGKKAWEQFRTAWQYYSSARSVVRGQLRARGLHERGGVSADDVPLHTKQDFAGFFDAVSLIDRIVMSGNPLVNNSWAAAPLEELERDLPDWARQLIAEVGNNYERQLLRNAEYYERAHGVVKSAYLVPEDMPPEKAAKKAPKEKPFGAEVD